MVATRFTAALLLLLGACGGAEQIAGAPDLGGRVDASTNNGDAAAAPDLAAVIAGDLAVAPAGTYRTSLSQCWHDATCARALVVAHGGQWSATGDPYDSNAALAAAYAGGADAIKIDVRVTKDNIPVISHSSPLQIYESVDCYNKKIEELTAAEVTQCHRFPSTTETFQRLDDVLTWVRGKMVAQLTVKLSTDFARTIAEVHALGAEDYAFLEIGVGDLQTLIPTISGADTVWYVVDLSTNVADVDTLLNTIKNPRAFLYEFDSSVTLGTLVSARLHPAGIRAFTYEKSQTATTAQLKAYFDAGYDVVSSNVNANAVAARVMVNTARGVSPP